MFTRQHKLWNDAQLTIATVTRFSWYFAASTTVFGRPIGQTYAIGNPSVCLSVTLVYCGQTA